MTRFLICGLLVSGCALKEYPSTTSTTDDTGEIGGDGGGSSIPPTEFTGGYFQMTSTGVDDNCGDGAFSTLLMPEGDDTPTDWEHLIEIPGWDDMETRITYNIDLQDPFSSMEVTVVQGDDAGEIQMDGGSQEDIPLFNDDSCFVDLSINATLQIVDEDNLTAQATLMFNDSSGLNCTFEKNCEMLLDFTARRSTE